jgi:hypothetical protein
VRKKVVRCIKLLHMLQHTDVFWQGRKLVVIHFE